MAENLPSFVKSRDEIKSAVEQNAIDRETLFIRMIVSHDIDGILQELEQLAFHYDKEEWRGRSQSIGIHLDALDLLDRSDPPLPYVYYFSTPELLIERPQLIFYYRNIAMLSDDTMRKIDLDSASYEFGATVPGLAEANEIATYFNGIVGAILLSHDKVLPKQHIFMFLANLNTN